MIFDGRHVVGRGHAPAPDEDVERPACAPHATRPGRPAIDMEVLCADDADAIAIEHWIAARCDADVAPGARNCATARNYRREASRFLLWLRIERGADLTRASLADGLAYRAFLADPQPRDRWCSARRALVGSPDWRPFEGPLATGSRRQALVILRGMFRFLQDQRYLAGNPFTGVSPPRGPALAVDTGRSLTRAQWIEVEHELETRAAAIGAKPPQAWSERERRDAQLAWVVRFLYATGLRRAEVSSIDCGDLRWVDGEECGWNAQGEDGTQQGGWVVDVVGKRGKRRLVPVPADLLGSLGDLLECDGGSRDPGDDPDRPLLLRFDTRGCRDAYAGRARLSGQGLYRQLKDLFQSVGGRLEREGRRRDAQALHQASTHWLRHSFGSHAVADGVPLDVVRASMGHSHLAVTSVYVRTELGRQMRESRRLNRTASLRGLGSVAAG